MTRLSITAAWNEAAAFVKRDFGALFAIAVAFSAFPNVALQSLTPSFDPHEGAGAAVILLMFAVTVVLGLVGAIAIASLALGRENVVGRAIAHGFRRFLPLLLGSLLLGIGLGLLGFVLVAVSGLTPAMLETPSPETSRRMLLIMLPLLLVGVAVGARFLLMTPLTADRALGPIALLQGSWALTRGHFWKLVGLLALLVVVLIIVGGAVFLVAGVLLSLLAGRPEPGTVAGLVLLVVSGLFNALVATLFTTLVARIYAQLTDGREWP